MTDDAVPVLTEIVEEAAARGGAGAVSGPALEALARELERKLLERLAPELERMFDQARAELAGRVTLVVREALAASLAQMLPRQD